MSTFTKLRAVLLGSLLVSCAGPGRPEGSQRLSYVGSSTIANFLRDAEPVYGQLAIEFDTEPESAGGEAAILDGRASLAGIAKAPDPVTLPAGVTATMIARDAIAVIINSKNPSLDLSSEALRDIFTGKVKRWSELGGPDLPIEPFIVSKESATHEVFRKQVLGEEPYVNCTEVRPDEAIIAAVAGAPGGIGQLSFSFLDREKGIRAISVDGEAPAVTNFAYPISRPLYLLWREGDPVVESFVNWTQSDAGQAVAMQHFVGVRVVGSVKSRARTEVTGTLVVHTETYAHYDGGIYYYPHRPYQVLTKDAHPLRSVRNHRGENDETPMRIDLLPGTYLIRAESSRSERPEFFVTINKGQTTELDVMKLLERR